jgi:hypothetical protein
MKGDSRFEFQIKGFVPFVVRGIGLFIARVERFSRRHRDQFDLVADLAWDARIPPEFFVMSHSAAI